MITTPSLSFIHFISLIVPLSLLRLSGHKEGNHNHEQWWSINIAGTLGPGNHCFIGLQEIATVTLTGVTVAGVGANAIRLSGGQTATLERLGGVLVITTNVTFVTQFICGTDGGTCRNIQRAGAVQAAGTLDAAKTILGEKGPIAAFHKTAGHAFHVVVARRQCGIVELTGTATNCDTIWGGKKRRKENWNLETYPLEEVIFPFLKTFSTVLTHNTNVTGGTAIGTLLGQEIFWLCGTLGIVWRVTLDTGIWKRRELKLLKGSEIKEKILEERHPSFRETIKFSRVTLC